jgi:hypothetical protein
MLSPRGAATPRGPQRPVAVPPRAGRRRHRNASLSGDPPGGLLGHPQRGSRGRQLLGLRHRDGWKEPMSGATLTLSRAGLFTRAAYDLDQQQEPREPAEVSFRLSFHPALLAATGADWLDDPPDLGCQETTCQHAVDGWPLSCNLLPCQERPTTPKPSPRCPAAASGWSPITAKLVRCTARCRWTGAGRGGRRAANATGSRPARTTGLPRSRAATRPPSLAAGRPGGRQGVGTPGRLATQPHQSRVRSPRSRPRRQAALRPEGVPGGLSASLVPSCTQRSAPSTVCEGGDDTPTRRGWKRRRIPWPTPHRR